MIKAYIKQLRENAESIGQELDIIWCTLRYGASPNNYKDFNFKNLSGKERKTYVTNRLSRKIITKCNQKEYVDIFENKIQFAQRFDKYFGRAWIATENMSFDMILTFIENKKKIIYKPIGNAQGKGIEVFDNLNDRKQIYSKIKEKNEKAILEEWICQHEDLTKVYDKAINCLRIITFRHKGNLKFLAGGVTWGNGKKIANACASGIVSPVNFKNGKLEKPAADFSGNVYRCHPLTGENLVGITLPYWNEIQVMLREATKEIPQVAYVGWDIAITPDGPIIIEGNTTPGYRYYQIPAHMEKKRGNRKIYEECLKEM